MTVMLRLKPRTLNLERILFNAFSSVGVHVRKIVVLFVRRFFYVLSQVLL